MSLNLSAMQLYCLESIGIDLWQLREPIQSSANDQCDPKLIEQLEMVLDYCSVHTKESISWQIANDLNKIILKDNKLTLPPLESVFADPKLKKALWQLMVNKS